MIELLYLVPVTGIIALIYTYIKSKWVENQDPGNEKMRNISKFISEGAKAFLKAEYKVILIFVVIVAVLLAIQGANVPDSSPLIALSFIAGALCSGIAGHIGMKVATDANVSTTAAARTSLNDALRVAFTGGSVMGMGVVGLGILGLSVLFLAYSFFMKLDDVHVVNQVISILTGFSFGASSIALFAWVGGGIYTKAADVGAALVG